MRAGARCATPLRAASPVILAALFASNLAKADSQASLTLMTIGTENASRSSRLNPGDALQTEGWSGEATAILEGKVDDLRWRLRASATASTSEDFGTVTPATASILLNELAYSHRFGAWGLTLGKAILNWNTGLAYQPLGFFRASKTDLGDIFDVEGRSEGLPLLDLAYLGRGFVAEAALSLSNAWGATVNDGSAVPDAGGQGTLTPFNQRQAAFRFSTEILQGVQVAFVARQPLMGPFGAGASMSYAAADSIELHGDLYEEPEHDLLRYVGGVTWTPLPKLAFYNEWIYRGDGLTGQQWFDYTGGVETHRIAYLSATSPAQTGAALGALGADASWLDTFGGLRRAYSYLRVEWGEAPEVLFLSAYFGLADGSALLTAAKGFRLPLGLAANVQASAFVGRQDAEFGLVPLAATLSLRLLRRF
jgi:hypothetical protein